MCLFVETSHKSWGFFSIIIRFIDKFILVSPRQVLFGLIMGWIVSVIMTTVISKTDGDTTSNIIDNIDWFVFPYPGKDSTMGLHVCNRMMEFML